ncbi:uncharacterized protein SOCE26_007280 [Sorangium cellulosum]|uniref:Secreted protein n=1 Tax=Sorangium cellulosum TaxID=56 RepID=A0A2L0EJ78_SORCE|nr:hypothetical protein [Sorangium cellulosum]AUX39339.1 uncharacterized protein SOCE26_007280 [Sorangium cellulosum]
MSSHGASVAALFGVCVFAFGCAAMPVEGDEEQVMSAQEAWVTTNGDSPTFFWKPSTQQALRRLALFPLVSNGKLAPTPLLDTAEGRGLLHYVVGCALPSGTTVSTLMPGVTFQGSVGLAPAWKTMSLAPTSSQRWVTSCLLQTLNGLDAHVPIRMLGSHVGLKDASPADALTYTIPDATMFGNIFNPAGVEVYACVDAGVKDACGAGWSVFADLRICDSSDDCGITLLGVCRDVVNNHCWLNSAGKPVCRTPGGTLYTEVISTFLDETGFSEHYPTCGGPLG